MPAYIKTKLNTRIPPVALALMALIFMLLLNRWLPLHRIEFMLQGWISAGIVCLGSLVALMAVMAFLRLHTTVDPRRPEKAGRLVMAGVYRHSRNPMYLGILLILLGIALYLGALSPMIIVLIFTAYIDRYQIVPEEQALAAKFGAGYREYARRVRRWI